MTDTESAADQGEGGLKWHERDALARAMHQTWHIGCHRECGGRLADSIKSDRVIAPAVERILAARTAALRAERDAAAAAVEGLATTYRAIGSSPKAHPVYAEAMRDCSRDLRALLPAATRGES